jgi:hypothetical protein
MSKWDIDFEIISIDLFMNCAIVKVDINYRVDERKFKEIQYLNLLKNDKGWLIYSKIFKFY